jgi:hypothetical protein
MLAKYPLAETPPASQTEALLSATAASRAVQLPNAEVSELIHLARAVLLKSPEDLAAIAQIAPAMPANWREAFTAERARAEMEAKFWSSAITYLMATEPGSVSNDR